MKPVLRVAIRVLLSVRELYKHGVTGSISVVVGSAGTSAGGRVVVTSVTVILAQVAVSIASDRMSSSSGAFSVHTADAGTTGTSGFLL